MARKNRAAVTEAAGGPSSPPAFPPVAGRTPVMDVSPPPETEESRAERLDGERKPKPFDLEKPDDGERFEPAPVRARDLINEALGANTFCVDWRNAADWVFEDGYPFAVTRFYPHHLIAVDFPRKWRDVEGVARKKSILNAQGIVYIPIMPDQAMTINQLRARVTEERTAMGRP